MKIIVKKPGEYSESEKSAMLDQPTWGCGVSVFDWHYDSEETCLLVKGEVTVEYGEKNAESVSFGAGDLVTFPQGLSCVWKVTKPVEKHYVFK